MQAPCKYANLPPSGSEPPALSTHTMKKTLITLAALAASVASAVDEYPLTHDYTTADFVTNYERQYAYGTLTLPYTLDFTKDFEISATVTIGEGSVNEWGSPLFTTFANPYGKDTSNGGFRVWMNTNNEIYTSINGDVNDSQQQGWGITENGWKSSNLGIVQAGDVLTLTYTYTAETNFAEVVLGIGDKTDTRSATITSPGSITALGTGAGFHNATAWSIETTVKHVPEPATATLSLLALAGLAARRRRK